MSWFLKLPPWLRYTVPAVLGTLLFCTLRPHPNPPNPYADTLATTRQAYEADTTRLLHLLAGLRTAQALAHDSAAAAEVRQLAAERRLRYGLVAVAAARQALAGATTVRDSLDQALVVIAKQDTALAQSADALRESKAAFSRLTEAHGLAITRVDSAEAGWARTRARLGLAEAALAIERKRVGCSIDLLVTRVGCPSRGVMLVAGAVGGAIVYSQLQRRRS